MDVLLEVHDAEELERAKMLKSDLARYGARTFLIGESLMRQQDVAQATRALLSKPLNSGGF